MKANHPAVFSSQSQQLLEGLCQHSTDYALGMAKESITIAVNTVVAVFVVIFEYEILYRVFAYLAGTDNQYWTPSLMATSSFIMVCAIHYLAHHQDKHPLMRVIERLAGWCIPVYLTGIMLLLATILLGDGGELFSQVQFDINALEEDNAWLETLHTDYASPFAGVIFSLGVGTLAILNVFVAHRAINATTQAITRFFSRRQVWREDVADLACYREAQLRYQDASHDAQAHTHTDIHALREIVCHEALEAIQEGLKPAHMAANNAMLMNETSPLLPQGQLNVEQLKRAIKPIQAITFEDLMRHLTPTTEK